MYCFYNILPLTDVKHYIFGIILLLLIYYVSTIYNNGGFIVSCQNDETRGLHGW